VLRATSFTSIIIALAVAGCVDGFRGSNVQLDLPQALPPQPRALGAPVATDLPANTHYRIYAIEQSASADRLFELAQFEIHRIVDISSPCFIDVGEHVPYPGLHVTSFVKRIAAETGIVDPANPPPTATEAQKILLASAIERLAVITQALGVDATVVKAVTSASVGGYPAVAASCTGPADQLPPASCLDDASNQRRLAVCQATWRADPDLFEGTDRVLTLPLNGVTRGFVDVPANNPFRVPPIGGAQFLVPQALDDIDAYAIYSQVDGTTTPGVQVLFGRPTMPTRGVTRVHLVSPSNPAITAEMAIFADLGQDDVQF
jgi:hypothetical protein